MDQKKIEKIAQVLAQYELFDWNTLPDSDPTAVRDKQAFREIAQAVLLVVQG